MLSIALVYSDIMIGASLAPRYSSNGTRITGVPRTGLCTDAAVLIRVGTAHVPRVRTAFYTLSLRTFDSLDCAANAKINLRYSLYNIRYYSGGVHALT